MAAQNGRGVEKGERRARWRENTETGERESESESESERERVRERARERARESERESERASHHVLKPNREAGQIAQADAGQTDQRSWSNRTH
eukprot:1636670-Rhodomonas_salina.1